SRVETLRSNTALPGRPDAWLNLIHVDDAVRAIICSTEGEPGAIYNVVDDEPVVRQRYFRRLAELVGAPAPVFDAALDTRRGSGGLNKRCSNRKIRKVLGLTLKFPSFETGLVHCLSESIIRPD